MNPQDGRLTQYSQLCEDFRLYDRQFWQVPSFLALICSAVIGVAYRVIDKPWPRVALLSIGFALALGISIALVKYRFFQATRIAALETLEGNPDTRMVAVQRITNRGPRKPSNFIERRSAFRWMIGIAFFMCGVLLALFVISFVGAVAGN